MGEVDAPSRFVRVEPQALVVDGRSRQGLGGDDGGVSVGDARATNGGRASRAYRERLGRRCKHCTKLIGTKIRRYRQGQREDARHNRRRKTGAAQITEPGGLRHGEAGIDQNDFAAGLPSRRTIVPARGADRDPRSEVRISRPRPGGGGRRDGDHANAIGGFMVGYVVGFVPGRNDDGAGDAVSERSTDNRLAVLRTRLCAPQAQVDDLRGVEIGGSPRNVESCSPRDAIEDIGEKPTAFSEHAHGQNLGAPVDPCGPDAVVAVRGDDAGDRLAVPTTGRDNAIAAAERAVDVGLSDPVPRITCIGVASAAIVGHVDVRNKIVAREEPPGKASVRPRARIDDRDDSGCASGRDIPRAVDAVVRRIVA